MPNKPTTQSSNANSKAQTRIKQLRTRLQSNKKLEDLEAYRDSNLNVQTDIMTDRNAANGPTSPLVSTENQISDIKS